MNDSGETRVTRPVTGWAGLVLIVLLGRAAAAGEAIQWDFDSPREVTAPANLEPGRPSGGHFVGQSSWDPYFSLRLPPAGIDANQLTWLTVRLYSSAAADVLDVYYESPDGRWCLGGKYPVVQGWATYRIDLDKKVLSMLKMQSPASSLRSLIFCTLNNSFRRAFSHCF